MWTSVDLGRGLLNSVIICGIAALLATIVATAAAYPLARYAFRGKTMLLYSALGLQMVPGPMVLLPMFVIFAVLQVLFGITIVGSYWGVILAYLTFSLPLSLWLMLGYIRTIPREVEEAASVDGGPARNLRRIVMPLAVPGMVVAFVFSILLGWNDVLFASVLTSDSTRTVAIDLDIPLTAGGQALPAYGQLMAAGVVVAIPVVVAYLSCSATWSAAWRPAPSSELHPPQRSRYSWEKELARPATCHVHAEDPGGQAPLHRHQDGGQAQGQDRDQHGCGPASRPGKNAQARRTW